ncbi:hypothetical protein [Streptomyces sp. ST1020]|uniref:hypothetical protein n=1 Tax=Streptomyces sp. ST1020 TaxID=1848901 RepID=UPI0034C5FAF5
MSARVKDASQLMDDAGCAGRSMRAARVLPTPCSPTVLARSSLDAKWKVSAPSEVSAAWATRVREAPS